MEIRASAGPDRPHPLVLAAVAATALAAGLGLARAAARVTPPVAVPSAEGDTPGPGAATGLVAGEALADVEGPPAPPDDERAGDAAVAEPPEPEASTGPPPAAVVPPRAPAARGAAPAPVAWSRIIRGRVAYLRCVGASSAEGAAAGASDGISGCPRDHALEEQVWGAIELLPACASPPIAPGDFDLVVDLTAGEPVEVRARDRFAPDVVRLDAARALACLEAPLAAAASTLGASRLVVSFRFRAVPE